MKRLVSLVCALAGAAACGDNLTPGGGDDEDAVQPDAPNPDAMPPTDAATATHAGTISVFDVRLRNQGGAGVDGHGIQVGISFVDLATAQQPIMEESPGNPTDGCKLWEYTPAQLVASFGSDQGPVQVCGDGPGAQFTCAQAGNAFPPCVFMAGVGYICPDAASSGSAMGATFASPATSLTAMTTTTVNKFNALDVGRYIRFSGTGNAILDNAGPLPIVDVPTAGMGAVVVFAGVEVTAAPTTGTYTVLAGVGPIPGAPATGFLADNEMIKFEKAASANFEAFPANVGFTGAGGIGDAFTLGTMNGKVTPTSIPTDGSAFTVGCDDAAACGTALGSILNIITTDATLGPSPFSFPPPDEKRVQIRCIEVGATTITVPAAYSARLTQAMSGGTRIQATFIRSNQAGATNMSGPPNTVLIAGGHAEVGFTNIPQPSN
ncbi:MAG: hypothetical protein F9K40_02060 [Kofleriaceae bacterium]|nr:MAG: hypothetical protein F9K40_02060 [Kofleriaceae bacterium]MBZ0230996.1 hypothetical protein [Kofleriaceae bacterium]